MALGVLILVRGADIRGREGVDIPVAKDHHHLRLEVVQATLVRSDDSRRCLPLRVPSRLRKTGLSLHPLRWESSDLVRCFQRGVRVWVRHQGVWARA